ncbi:uncharacterized protein N7482_001201 [Penicillium canariense]|uniref:Uncharacterized protein n=1 Tax=Penicillium canariense TaxID=189055 RepID=A0A9W9LTP1_9EURO|nr:uncharacterized protein N7482_001201 [Penicillium canariense]KAJ5175324.1 hypothetical protein N7482_001201 [Penicillium canariense]
MPQQTIPPKKTIGWIWPKDPRPGNPTRWPRRWRFSDVLKGKGPDIYVGVIGKRPTPTPDDSKSKPKSATNWARWDKEPEEDDTPFPWARRGKEKYDYRVRRYQIPNPQTWSSVEYCDAVWSGGRWGRPIVHKEPRTLWDRYGRPYGEEECDDPDYYQGVDQGECEHEHCEGGCEHEHWAKGCEHWV